MKTLLIPMLLLVLQVLSADSAVIAQNELAATVIEINEWRDYVPQPIKIVGLKYGDHKVESGESFQAPLSWIKDLSVRVKNVSAQTLRYVEVTVNFARDANDSPILAQVSLYKGFPYIFSAGPPTTSGLSLVPGEELDLTVSQSAYEAHDLDVRTIAPSDSILRTAMVKTEAVAFSPNRIWMRGAYFDRDPQDPKNWIVDQEEQDKLIRRIQNQKLGLTVKRVSFNPTAFSMNHVIGGCYRFDGGTVLNCSGTGCTGCTVVQDKVKDVPIGGVGWNRRCFTAMCRYYVNGQLVICPGCTKLVLNLNYDNPCDAG